MGGLDTEVTADTRRVLLEAAVWEPSSIRATSRRLNLVSEASVRFERRVDPEGAARGVARAVQLLTDLAGARPTGTGTERAEPTPPWAARSTVTIDPTRIQRLAAVDELDGARQRPCSSAPAARSTGDDTTLEVTAPTWRGDLTRPADLAEEVLRLHGYDRIPARLPLVEVTGGLTPAQQLERTARRTALAAGFHEAVTRPFVGEDALIGVLPTPGRVALENPLAKDAAAMRPSLVEGLLVALRRNAGQGRPGTALVELGRLFRPADDDLGGVLDAFGDGWRWAGPDGTAGCRSSPAPSPWRRRGCGWGTGGSTPTTGGASRTSSPSSTRSWRGCRRRGRAGPCSASPWSVTGSTPAGPRACGWSAPPGVEDHEIGVVGQLHPVEADRRDLPEPVVVAELLLEPLLRAVPDGGYPPVRATELVRHPAMSVDVALVADDEVPFADLEAAVRRGGGDLLDGWWWFDEYRGEQVGEGRRSVAIRLRLQAPDRQLTDEDAERVIEAVATAASEVGATLRR
jgi:phenylalanyl-tRNA synthetase beta chain